MTQLMVYPWLLAGVLMGVAATVPPREFVRRASKHRTLTGLAVVGLLPYFHRFALAPEWRLLHPVPITMAQWLLDIVGVDTTATGYSHRRYGLAVLLRSQHWEVLISKECSGFSVIGIFVALFASMLLQNPARFSSLGVIALSGFGGLLAVMGVQAGRWAALVAFAEQTIRDSGRSRAAYQAIDAYHGVSGQWAVVASLVLWAVYFSVVSRWLDRRTGAARGSTS